VSAAGARECRACGHAENRHRGNGACLAVVEVEVGHPVICQCNDYEPSREPVRSSLRSVGEKGRAHERRMRKLRPEALDRDRHRCLVALADDCRGYAEVVHHIWPSEKGGPDDLTNLISSCVPCHDWIHNDNPRQAKMLGLLRDGG